MWDAMEANPPRLPGDVTAIIFTDGTAEHPDELEQTLAVFAPITATFLVADPHRAQAIVARAKQLALTVEGGDPNASIYILPSSDLTNALGIIQQVLADKVSWTTSYLPAPASSASREEVVEGTPFAQTQAPAVPVSHKQPTSAPVYSSEVIELATQTISKRPDAKKGQMTIACMSSKGGAGKSTVALCLAGQIAASSVAAGDPKKVVIVDLDTRDGQVGSLIGQYTPTSISIRVLPNWDAETVLKNLVHDKKLGIDALLAPVRPRNADDVGPKFYRQIIQILQTTHDVVILDCSVNYLDSLLGVGFALADEILFVTTLATTSVQGMARSLKELLADPSEGGVGIPKSKIGVVANQVINNVGMGKDKLLMAALGAPLIGQIPAEHDVVLVATNRNQMSTLLRHGRLGPAYFKLASMCLPDWNLAPLVAEATGGQVTAQSDASNPQAKRGFLKRQ
jgi:MinD-like ATPase involved in chromosome partitioning or flagellar assembly